MRCFSSIYHSNKLTSSCRPLTRKSIASLFTVLNCSINHTLFHSSALKAFGSSLFFYRFWHLFDFSVFRQIVEKKNRNTVCAGPEHIGRPRFIRDRSAGMAMNRILKLPKCVRNAHPKLTMAFFPHANHFIFTAHAATRKAN